MTGVDVTTLAHGSGVDEAIAVLVPLALVIVLLRMGAKKAPPEDEPADGGPGEERTPEEPGQHST